MGSAKGEVYRGYAHKHRKDRASVVSEVVDWLVDHVKRHSDVAGIFLASMGESSIRIAVIVNERRGSYRRGRTIKGIWIDEYFNTFERLTEAIDKKEEAHTYIFKSGQNLYDPEGHVSELMRLAKRTLPECRGISSKNGQKKCQSAFSSLVEYRRVLDTRIREHVIATL